MAEAPIGGTPDNQAADQRAVPDLAQRRGFACVVTFIHQDSDAPDQGDLAGGVPADGDATVPFITNKPFEILHV